MPPVCARRLAPVSLLLAGLWPAAVAGQLPADALGAAVARLEPAIRAEMEAGSIPSLTIAVVDRAGVLWSGAYGYSNLWARTPASVETVYLIGSTFKPQSAAALLQQAERGAFALDDPVAPHMGGLSIGREDPALPVTFRHLLTHTSGLPAGFGPHPLWGETAPPPLRIFLRDSLRLVADPGEAVLYSNLGYSLIAWLVERTSGVAYRDYVRTRLWEPLGMRSTAFAPTPAMEERLAVPYAAGPDGRPAAAARLRANVWPAAMVYGTVLDQARWLRFNLGDGTAPDGTRLLRAETLAAMHATEGTAPVGEALGGGWGGEDAGYGLGWWTTTRGDERFFGHGGNVPGYSAFVMGSRDRGVGVVILTNADGVQERLARLSILALDLLAGDGGRAVAHGAAGPPPLSAGSPRRPE